MPNSVLGTGNTAGTPPVLAVVGNSTDEVACSAEIETQAWKRDIWTQDGGGVNSEMGIGMHTPACKAASGSCHTVRGAQPGAP